MWTFIMQSVAFITSTTSSYKAYFLCTNKSYIFREQILLLAPMTTYLKDLTQSIGRYGKLFKHGFKVLDAQVVSLLSVEFSASKGIGQAPHVTGSITI